MTEIKYTKKQVLCTGNIILARNRRGTGFIILDEAGNETKDEMVFTKSKSTSGSPGIIYETLVSENGFKGGLEYVGPVKDQERRAELQLQSRGNDTHLQALSIQKKEETSDEALCEILRPLRSMYNRTNPLGKAAIIARVISIIQRGI